MIKITNDFNFKFNDSIAVVSGGFQGIGEAIVIQLIRAGCKVYTIDPKFPHTPDKFTFNKNVTRYSGYTSNSDDMENFFQYIYSKESHIDFLVNNAGIYFYKNIENSSLEDFNNIIAANILGEFNMTKYCTKLLKNSTHPSIVNIASVSGQRTEEGHTLYSTTKGATLAFTKALAADFGKYKIRVNSVSPGNIKTPMNDIDIEAQAKIKGKNFAEIEKEYSSESILQRRGTADEVASVVLFLLSSASSYINGEDIIVDGGLYLV